LAAGVRGAAVAPAAAARTNDAGRWLQRDGVIGAMQQGETCFLVYKPGAGNQPEIVTVTPKQNRAATAAGISDVPLPPPTMLSQLSACWHKIAWPEKLPLGLLVTAAVLTLAGLGVLNGQLRRRYQISAPAVPLPVAHFASRSLPSASQMLALHQKAPLPPLHLSAALARPAELSGSLDAVSLETLLQMFHTEGQSGTLTVTDADHKLQGEIIFQSGAMAAVKTPQVEGADALRDILKCRRGRFAFDPQAQPPIRQPLVGDFTALLMDALRGLDESAAALSPAKA